VIFFVSVAISYAWVYGVYFFLGPWINAFSIPVFLLWIIGVFFQLLFIDKFIRTEGKEAIFIGVLKLILGFPIVLVLSVVSIFALSLFNSYLSRLEPKTFLMDENFAGRVRVIYGEECGINPPIENGRRIFQIPENGILIIQPEFEDGIIDHEYYFVDNDGEKTNIAEYENYSDGTKTIPGVVWEV